MTVQAQMLEDLQPEPRSTLLPSLLAHSCATRMFQIILLEASLDSIELVLEALAKVGDCFERVMNCELCLRNPPWEVVIHRVGISIFGWIGDVADEVLA